MHECPDAWFKGWWNTSLAKEMEHIVFYFDVSGAVTNADVYLSLYPIISLALLLQLLFSFICG